MFSSPKLRIIIVLVAVQLATAVFFLNYYNTRIFEIKRSQEESLTKQFKTVITSFYRMTSIFSHRFMNHSLIIEAMRQSSDDDPSNDSIAREQLYKILMPIFKNFKEHNIKQFHFHTTENKSILRLHKPDIYGDDLTNIRYSVKETNRTKKIHIGFEEGRIFNGFRYVFPFITSRNEHLGSVEVSLSLHAFTEEIEDMTNKEPTYMHYMIKKKIVEEKVMQNQKDRYFTTDISDDYMYEMSALYDKYEHIKSTQIFTLNKIIKKDIKSKLESNKIFSVLVPSEDFIISFLPIPNVEDDKNAAYLIMYKKSFRMKEFRNNIMLIFILLVIISFLISYMIYKGIKQNLDLKKNNFYLREKSIEISKLQQEQNKQIIQQSKMASMGEMINVIAHQWKQPLNGLMLLISATEEICQEEKPNTSEILDLQQKAIKQIESMDLIIKDFSSFFKPSEVSKKFKIELALKEVLRLLNPQLNRLNIKAKLIIKNNAIIQGNITEFKQVIVNIISNSKDAIANAQKKPNNKVKDGLIQIEIITRGEFINIYISDNGGGISKEHHINDIFKYHFSSKGSNGSGIGLSISKIIIEDNMGGKLTVRNTDIGAEFNIKFKEESE